MLDFLDINDKCEHITNREEFGFILHWWAAEMSHKPRPKQVPDRK